MEHFLHIFFMSFTRRWKNNIYPDIISLGNEILNLWTQSNEITSFTYIRNSMQICYYRIIQEAISHWMRGKFKLIANSFYETLIYAVAFNAGK